MAVGHSVEVAWWAAETDRLLDRMAARFARVETRRRARAFLFGLLAELPWKNCRTIAEHAGDRDPPGCSTSSPAPAGTPTVCETTCATT